MFYYWSVMIFYVTYNIVKQIKWLTQNWGVYLIAQNQILLMRKLC